MRAANIRLWLAVALGMMAVGAACRAVPAPASAPMPTVLVDQAGYATEERKIAYAPAGSGGFAVVDTKGRVVFRGALGRAVQAKDAGAAFAPADFTSLRVPGTYSIRLENGGQSPSFRIAARPHREALGLALGFFSYQRCGAALREGSPYDHAACHLDDAVMWADPRQRVPAVGGWHDAGDYGKYSLNTAYAAALMLALLERRPDLDTELPLRAEIQRGLTWLLTVQDTNGAVFHKLTGRHHPGGVQPDRDRAARFLFPSSSTATGDFAAAMAMAARIYRASDPTFAVQCLTAAERAWAWLQANPRPVLFKNPPDNSTGAYGDHDDSDERFWAAVELHRATGNSRYLEYIRSNAGRWDPAFSWIGSWQNVSVMALLSLGENDRLSAQDPLRRRVREDLVSAARRTAARCGSHALGIPLGMRDYTWGSNGAVLNHALLLLEGGRVSGDPALTQAGRDQVHYLLGRNAVGVSFVTGVGERAVRRPHHRPSNQAAKHPPVPGLLVGGPNGHEGKDLSPFPATCYVDDESKWTVNEPAINLNAELVLVLGLADRGR